jgi:hypothetical protein
MVIWKGWGIMALLIPLLCSLLAGTLFDSVYGENVYKNSDLAMPLVLAMSGVFVYIFGYQVNSRPGRILVDPENNEKIELKSTHSMFWIPLQYWSGIIIAVSVWMYVANIGLIYQK